MTPPLASSCCNAPVTVSAADEGTSRYVCTACGNPCDAVEPWKWWEFAEAINREMEA